VPALPEAVPSGVTRCGTRTPSKEELLRIEADLQRFNAQTAAARRLPEGARDRSPSRSTSTSFTDSRRKGALTNADLQKQIDVLNQGFSGQDPDAPVGSRPTNTPFRFVMATTSDGSPDVTRITNNVQFLWPAWTTGRSKRRCARADLRI
jgi:hypothetical protein